MKQKIRKGDNVRVMRGDKADVDKVGEVIRVLRKEERVVVQGVNMVKKHQKQQQSGGKTLPSGIMEFEAPIHISNVALVTEANEKEAKASVGKRTPAAKATVAKKPVVKAEKKETVKSAVKKPVVKKPVAKVEKKETVKPATKKPAVKKPAVKAEKKETVKPATKKPAEKKPVAKKPAATKPAAAKKPAVAKAPAAKKPATKKTADK
jgi:ribosomal protein L24